MENVGGLKLYTHTKRNLYQIHQKKNFINYKLEKKNILNYWKILHYPSQPIFPYNSGK